MSLQGFSGAAGIKYGLNLRGVKKPAPARGVFAASADDGDEEAEEDRAETDAARANIQIARQQAQQRESQKVQELYANALAEDASVFDYDGVYDQMKAKQQPAAPSQRAGPTAPAAPKYIGQLLNAAKAREREQEVVFERRQVKERQKEDHLYGDKDKFVTAAYKAKLAEDAKWLAEEQAREAEEAAADVTKRRDLSGFYANLMTRNAAFGGKDTAAAGGNEAAQVVETEQKQNVAASQPMLGQEDAAPLPVTAVDVHRETEPPLDVPATVSAGPVEAPADDLAVATRLAAQETVATLLPASAASRAKASEEAVAQARERYLARKRQRDETAQ